MNYQMRRAQRSKLPYPKPEATLKTDTTAFGAMVRAATNLDGYTVLYVVEQRPPAEVEQLNRVSSGYSADEQGISPGAGSGEVGHFWRVEQDLRDTVGGDPFF
jgi:hypothetical protein